MTPSIQPKHNASSSPSLWPMPRCFACTLKHRRTSSWAVAWFFASHWRNCSRVLNALVTPESGKTIDNSPEGWRLGADAAHPLHSVRASDWEQGIVAELLV